MIVESFSRTTASC